MPAAIRLVFGVARLKRKMKPASVSAHAEDAAKEYGTLLRSVTEFIVDCEHKTAPLSADGYPSIRTPNVGRGRLVLDGVNRVDEPTYHEWTARAKPRSGDIILAREAPVGNVALIPPGLDVCLGQRTVLIRPDHSKINAQYLTYLLLGDEIQAIFRSQSQGATVPHLNLADIRSVRLPPLPARDVQDRIADVLSTYDDLIENNAKRIKTLEEMARSLYREWFVDHPPFKTSSRNDTVLGPVPHGWAVAPLASLCQTLIDGDWIESKDQGGSAYRLLQVSNIGRGAFVETGNYRFISQQTYARLRCTEVVPEDILVSRMPTPIGRAWLVTSMPWRMVTSVDVAIIKVNPTMATAPFLAMQLNDDPFIARASKSAGGATRPRVTRRDLASLPVLVPPLPLQRQFAEHVAPIVAQIQVLRHSSESARSARDLLLPPLISGKIEL